MKRIIALLLTLIFTLGAFSAFAEETAAIPQIYVGQGDKLTAAGSAELISEEPVSRIYYYDDTCILYATDLETDSDGIREQAIYLIDNAGDEIAVIDVANNVRAAAWSAAEGLLYFVTEDEPALFKSFDPATQETKNLMQAEAGIDGIYISADGPILVLGLTEKLYIPVVRMLADPLFPHTGYTMWAGDGYETLLDAEGRLFFRRSADEIAYPVSENVLIARPFGEQIYCILNTAEGPMLRAYNTNTISAADLGILPANILPQIALADGAVILLDDAGTVYAYILQSGELQTIGTVPEGVDVPVINAIGNTALIYNDAAETGSRFAASFELTLPAETDEEPAEEIAEEETEEEVKPEPAKKPEPEERTLAKGMRGDDVKALQSALKKHGYLAGKADGIFGEATQKALLYLQSDLDVDETGKATPSLQKKLAADKNIPDFTKYVALSKGDEGIRVRELQTRLRTLCYLTEGAGGHYKTKTAEAVKRFQRQNGYEEANKITAKQLKFLFSDDCPKCTEYYELSQGESSPAIKRLNNRLNKLNYFSGKVGESFTKSTTAAIKLFQSYNGLQATGKCDGNLQRMIFSSDAKKYVNPDKPAEPTFKKLTDKRLKTMRKWFNKNFGGKWKDKKVANTIQAKLSELEYLEEGYQSGKWDKKTWNALLAFQRHEMDDPWSADGTPTNDTLNFLFFRNEQAN